MPSNKTYICVKCRFATKHGGSCPSCGEPTLYMGNWSPPKKNNRRAWKRIGKGEYLWDRRRVRKNPPNAAYTRSSWVHLPGHKKGQRGIFQPNVSRENGPDVDLGG